MSTDKPHHVKEAPAKFNSGLGVSAPVGPMIGAPRQYRAKVFKSGNSLALRLPAGLGLQAGMEMNIQVEIDGSYRLELAPPPRRKIDISGFAGKAPGIKLAPREDFEERPSTIAAREAARKAAGTP